MKDFLLRKFEIEHYALQSLIRSLEAQEEDVPEFSIKCICHIINVHHRWNCQLNQTKPESNDWDVFPLHFLERLNRQNFIETNDYLEKQDLGRQFQNESSTIESLTQTATDILFHLLQHAAYHRGQIILNLKSQGLKFPVNGFVQLED